MQKSSSFITEEWLTLGANYKQKSEITNDNHDISFDKLLQKCDDDQSNLDIVFNPIKIQQAARSKSVYNILSDKNTHKQSLKQNKHSTGQSINQIIESSKLKMENKKLEHQMARVKDKYEKIIRNKEQAQKQLFAKLNKQNQQLKLKFASSQSELNFQKLANAKISQQLKSKSTNIDKQLSRYKQQIEYYNKQKQKTSNKCEELEKKLNCLQGKVGELQKNLRIKDKQLKKYQQLQQQRNKYYQQTFVQKENYIQNLKEQFNKKSEQILIANQQRAILSQSLKKMTQEIDILSNDRNSFKRQIQQKNKILERVHSFIHQGTSLVQQHLSHLNEAKNVYSIRQQFTSKRFRVDKYNSGQIRYQDSSKNLIDLIMKIIQKNNEASKLYQIDRHNFQQQYSRQLSDLEIKMNYLVEENKHLKVQKQNLKVQKQQLNNRLMYQSSNRMPFQQKNQINYKREEEKLRKTIKLVQRQRQINTQEFKNFMNMQNSYQSKIKQQIFDRQSARVKQQVEKARKIFNQVTLRSQSVSLMKERSRQCSEPNLHKRSRKSLSWKKPSDIMKQYI